METQQPIAAIARHVERKHFRGEDETTDEKRIGGAEETVKKQKRDLLPTQTLDNLWYQDDVKVPLIDRLPVELALLVENIVEGEEKEIRVSSKFYPNAYMDILEGGVRYVIGTLESETKFDDDDDVEQDRAKTLRDSTALNGLKKIILELSAYYDVCGMSEEKRLLKNLRIAAAKYGMLFYSCRKRELQGEIANCDREQKTMNDFYERFAF